MCVCVYVVCPCLCLCLCLGMCVHTLEYVRICVRRRKLFKADAVNEDPERDRAGGRKF
jgi:hypothetical protein